MKNTLLPILLALTLSSFANTDSSLGPDTLVVILSADFALPCDAPLPAIEATVLGGCYPFTFEESINDLSGGCGGVIERTVTATDATGITGFSTQYINLIDTVAPILTCPPNALVLDILISDPDLTGWGSAYDNCSNATLDYTDGAISGTIPPAFVRTWSSVDTCLSLSTCVQIITEAEFVGCTDMLACNYNDTITLDDGSCIFAIGCDTCSGEIDGSGVLIDNPDIGDSCDDDNPLTFNDVYISCDSCGGVVSLSEYQFDIAFDVFPVPAQDEVTVRVEAKESEDYTLEITDLLGAVLYREAGQNGSTKLSVSDWSTGIYMVRVLTEKGMGLKELLVED